MFKFNTDNKDTENLLKIIEQLRADNQKLKEELNEIANNSGNCIIKQMPDGTMELNGEPFDNSTDVDYYNSSKATFGELTMFRVGKESKQREMDKLIKIHMEEIDDLKEHITSLNDSNNTLKNEKDACENIIYSLKEEIRDRDSLIERMKSEFNEKINQAQVFLNETKTRYESYIEHLNEDVNMWKYRYLKINNVTSNGTIITKYGKVLSKIENIEGDINNEEQNN